MLVTSKEFNYNGKTIIIFANELNNSLVSVQAQYKNVGNCSKNCFAEQIYKPNVHRYLEKIDLDNCIIKYYNNIKEYCLRKE